MPCTYASQKALVLGAGFLEEAYYAALLTLVRAVAAEVIAGHARGLIWVQTRAYDETPMKSRVLNAASQPSKFAGSAGEIESISAAKVVAHFRGFGFVLAYRNQDGQDTYHHVVGRLPTKLMVVTRQKKAAVLALLQRFRALEDEVEQAVAQVFQRRVVLSTADSHSSNIIAEEADGNLSPGCAHEHLRCTIHRMDTCEKRCSDLVPRTISGVVNWGLWIAEHLAELRQEMANIIREKPLRVLKPPLSGLATDHRADVRHVFARRPSSFACSYRCQA